MITWQSITSASQIVYRDMQPTPQLEARQLSELMGVETWVKYENTTPIGSFKLRGALSYCDRLARAAKAPSALICSTRGNHGQAVTLGALRNGMRSIVVVPEENSTMKNRMMRALGCELIEHGADYTEARKLAEQLATERGYNFATSYNEPWLSGIATLAWEMLQALPHLEKLYVPVGMGSGLLGAMWVRDILDRDTEIIGVVAERAAAYALSFSAGQPVSTETADTIADGLSARTPNPDALVHMMSGVSHFVTVTESEILAAMRLYMTHGHVLAEPSAAAALAAALKEKDQHSGPVGLVLTGGNASGVQIEACISRKEEKQ